MTPDKKNVKPTNEIPEGSLRPVACKGYEGQYGYDLTVEIEGMPKDKGIRNFYWLREQEIRNMVNLSAAEFEKVHKPGTGGSHSDRGAKYSWKYRDYDSHGPMEKLAALPKFAQTMENVILWTLSRPGSDAAVYSDLLDAAKTAGYLGDPHPGTDIEATTMGFDRKLREMVERGFISKAERGIYSITDLGRERLTEEVSFPARSEQDLGLFNKRAEEAKNEYNWTVTLDVVSNFDDGNAVAAAFNYCSPSLEHLKPGQDVDVMGTGISRSASLNKSAEPPKPKDPPTPPAAPPEYKELKIRPKEIEPKEVETAIEPSEAMKKAYNKIKNSQNQLAELKRLVASLRAEFDTQARKAEEEGGRLKEESSFKQGIDELALLISQAEHRVVNFGDRIVAYVEETGKKEIKAGDKWKLEKLLSRYGEEAEKYLESAVRGLQAQAEPETVRKVIEFEMKSHGAKPQARPSEPNEYSGQAALGKKDVLNKKADALEDLKSIFNNVKYFLFETTRSLFKLDELSSDAGIGENEKEEKV